MAVSDRFRRSSIRASQGRVNTPLPLLQEEGAEFAGAAGIDRVAVLFPLPLPEPFDYKAPSSWNVVEGAHVIAPLGPNLYRGVVWRVERDAPGAANLKSVEEVCTTAPPLPEETRKFIEWTAKYVCTQPGQILRMVVRSPDALEPSPIIVTYGLAETFEGRMTDARSRVLAAAKEGADTPANLARKAEVTGSVVKGLIEAGALVRIDKLEDEPFAEPQLFPPPLAGEVDAAQRRTEGESPGSAAAPSVSSPAGGGANRLSELQQSAANELIAAVNAYEFRVALLDGVTGSGKTEVYLEAVAAALARDPAAQALVLLPEIALTQAVLSRFEARFGARPVEWHSAITPKARRRAWREVAAGRARLIAGARSALFLPFPNLKLIVVDEEHDPSYKQDEGVAYQARDLTVARAKQSDALVILASATPSLESYSNAKAGRYAHIRLPVRHGAAVLPDIELVDMKLEPPERGRWISPKLIRAAAEAWARGEQSLFYMNRRGYAPLTLCRGCGHKMKAPDSESWLVEHRYTNKLVCHLTGFSMTKPKHCPTCLAPDSFTSIGPGVERVEEELRDIFPDARTEVFSSDTAQTGAEVRAIIERMANNEIDILIGTQIVAKGHNFPNLTMVGVVDADLGLKGGDLRAGERTFQLISQVSGRAGRADRPGRALIQTYDPENEIMQALARQDRDGFLDAEARAREDMGMPPFGRLGALIVAAPGDAESNAAANALGAAAPATDGVDVWGPAPAPLSVIRGMHRRRFLVRADRGVDLSAYVAAWTGRVKLASNVRLQIDVDPYSFL
jgi:primosomal protein N' (replication factor Y)